MKKVALLTVFCLALTACTAGLGAEPIIEDAPLNTTGIDAVTQAIEAYDARNSVPYTEYGYYFDETGAVQSWCAVDGDLPPADRTQPGDAEMTLQEAANLAESYREKLGWPDVSETKDWEVCYLPKDPELLAAFTWGEEPLELRPLFAARYIVLDGQWPHNFWITMDGVTGAVVALQTNSVPPLFYKAVNPEEYPAEAAAWNESVEKAWGNKEAVAADVKAVLAEIGIEVERMEVAVENEPMERMPEEQAEYEEGHASFRMELTGTLRDGRTVTVWYDMVRGMLVDVAIEGGVGPVW